MKGGKKIKDNGSWRSKLIWGVVTLAILSVLWLAVEKRSNADLQKVVVDIIDLKDKKNLLDEKLVLKRCREYLGYDLSLSTIGELDLKALEQMIGEDSRVKNAEVFVDNQHILHIGILQKQPIVRINSEDSAYYLDEDGGVIPLSAGATLRVPIATGSIGKYSEDRIFGNKPNNLKDVYVMAKHIYADKFLRSLIEQINVNDVGDFTLVPKVGKQQLVFGKAEFVEDRFENLKIFYKEGMPKVGWRKYDKLVLNWEGQVVAQKDI